MSKHKILVLLGTNRPTRNGRKIADWFMREASKDSRFEFELVDLAELNLPWLDEPVPPKVSTDYAHEYTRQWANRVAGADGYVIVTPEYNHSYPAILKNAIDYLYYEWGQKPIAFVGYGVEYGYRAVEHLRQIAVKLRMAPMSHQIEIHIFKQQTPEGEFVPSGENMRQLQTVLDQLEWWSSALRRERKERPYTIRPL